MFKENTEFDLIGMGEIMMRLSPPGKETIAKCVTFDKNVGGSEFNVVSGAAMLGANAAVITKLPSNKLGEYIKNQIRLGRVSDRYVISDASKGARLGVYYYENGAAPRKSAVIYDRANSSACSLRAEELPDDIYGKTKIFHISSITLAIDKTLRENAFEIIRRFKACGALVSFDVNYRAALWSEAEAKEVVERIFPMVDLLFVSEETSRRMLGRTGTLEEIMRGYAADYGCRLVATTRREAISPNCHNFGSKLLFDGSFYEEEPYRGIEVIDRVGSGDAYLSGVLYGLISKGDPKYALELGNASAAMKNTVPGDLSGCTLSDLEGTIASHKKVGAQDEMIR